MKDNRTRDIAYMAMFIALFAVLDLVTRYVPFFKMPNGGSIGLGTVAILLASYIMGWRKGLVVALLTIPVQFFIGSSASGGLVGFLLDYIIGYGIYGLASMIPNYKLFYPGVIVTNLIRLAAATMAGIVLWETPFWASLSYNATYLIPTMLVGLVLVPLIATRFDKLD